MEQNIAWYQEQFAQLKMEFQTRRGRADHEMLILLVPGTFSRITYISVTTSGVVLCGTRGVRIYADWNKGDRFVRMYHSLGWLAFSFEVSPPVMAWSEDAVWEVTPPSPLNPSQSID